MEHDFKNLGINPVVVKPNVPWQTLDCLLFRCGDNESVVQIDLTADSQHLYSFLLDCLNSGLSLTIRGYGNKSVSK